MAFLMDWVMDHLRSAGPADYWENKDIYAPLLRGQPIDFEQLKKLPDPLVIGGPRQGEILDIFAVHLKTPWFVSEKVKIAIERLEPYAHTFIEVNLVFKDVPQPKSKYFMLDVSQAIDAVFIEETEFNLGYGRAGFVKEHTIRRIHDACTLEHSLVSGKHLWRGGIGRVGGGVRLHIISFVLTSLRRRSRTKST